MGASKSLRRKFTGDEAITRLPIQPNVPVSRPLGDIGVGGGLGIPPRFPRRGRSPRGFLTFHRRTNDVVTTPGFPSDDNRRREVTTPGFPSDEKPGIRPPFRRSNDDMKYPRRKRRRRIGKKLSNEEKMRIKAKYDERRKLREEKGFAKRGSKDKQGNDRRRRGRRMRPRGSRPDIQLGRVTQPDGSTLITYGSSPGRRGRRRRKPSAVMETTRVPVKDPTLGGPPEREVPIPKERLPRITRESDPSGPAPFAPNERAMAQDRFFERMFEKADERKQQKSMMREERGRVKQSMRDESRMRMNEPGEINVGGEININAERRPRRMRRMRRMRR